MWRKLTEDDLIANLSRMEADAYRRDFEIDPVPAILDETAEAVRGHIESGRKCRLDPTPGTIPAMLVSAAVDYATFKLLKRMDVIISEPRTKAYDHAVALFDEIARGHVTPPDGVETTPEPPVKDPARPSVTRKHRLLGRHQEQGI